MRKYVIYAGVNGAGKTTLLFRDGECRDCSDDIPDWCREIVM